MYCVTFQHVNFDVAPQGYLVVEHSDSDIVNFVEFLIVVEIDYFESAVIFDYFGY